MSIDVKRLRGDAKRLKAVRVAAPSGKVRTGATKVIRDNFNELERLHNVEGVTWADLASSLAAQGVTQGAGLPITGRRLTALMHNVRSRAEKMAEKRPPQNGGDSSPQRQRNGGLAGQKAVSLNPEMARPVEVHVPASTISEDEIRQAELAKHAHLLRKR